MRGLVGFFPAASVLQASCKQFVGQHGHGHTASLSFVIERTDDEPFDLWRIMLWARHSASIPPISTTGHQLAFTVQANAPARDLSDVFQDVSAHVFEQFRRELFAIGLHG